MKLESYKNKLFFRRLIYEKQTFNTGNYLNYREKKSNIRRLTQTYTATK